MLYNTFEFGAFYLLVFALYWFVFQGRLKWQNLLILGASYFFYGWWDWRFLSLVVISSLTDFYTGIQIQKAEDKGKKKAWLAISLVVNIGLLGFFKYYGFFVDSFIEMFRAFGYEMSDRTLRIILPVGISFYTFQTLSYSIDIYRGRLKASNDLVSFLAFVSFFPQLIAGPIERASNLMPQFHKGRKFDPQKAKDGLRQILWGLFKKVLVADTLGEVVGWIISDPESYSGAVLLMGVLFFAFQLYGDFSGYSDIAIGTARLLGFNLMRNFNYPYFARDILDFWRRWHISLTTWFRDYVFLSLSGGKMITNKWKVIRNYIITFTISGLWHGANWTFVIWGFLHGLYHIPYLLFPKLRSNVQQTRPPFTVKGTLTAILQMGITWALNLFALVFFMSPNVKYAFFYFSKMFSSSLFQMPERFLRKLPWLIIFMAMEWVQMYNKKKHPMQVGKWPVWVRWTLYYGFALAILYFNYERRAFIYFQF
ncbi:MAG: MBOAT family protein [Bacteroidia bacterium]|nr:MBOAT family protein [Bacteroidia bacterium]